MMWHRIRKALHLVLGKSALRFASVLLVIGATAQLHAQSEARAILAGGCFWCLQKDIEEVPGVLKTEAGYAGGERPGPTYENYDKKTARFARSHIEVVEVVYDADIVSYQVLLRRFMRLIDPTDAGGQFCDRGPQYRPAIFARGEEEAQIAAAVREETRQLINKPVAVEVLPAADFWPAEAYHQHYAKKKPLRYKIYRTRCGRDKRIKQVWSAAKNKAVPETTAANVRGPQ